MGGKGSGGRRPGTGPKPKPKHLKLIEAGGAFGRTPDPAPTQPVERFPPPSDLFGEDLMVWEWLAPFAFEERTLTPGTAYAFSLLCRNIVREKKMALDPMEVNGANHRGIIQRIDAELLAFNLRPNGKAIFKPSELPAAPANPLDRFRRR